MQSSQCRVYQLVDFFSSCRAIALPRFLPVQSPVEPVAGGSFQNPPDAIGQYAAEKK